MIDVLYSELSECIPAPDDVAASADDTVINAVGCFLRELDAKTRILFVRRYFYMDSTNELAEKYGLKASNVSTKLNRVRLSLKEYLEKEGITI